MYETLVTRSLLRSVNQSTVRERGPLFSVAFTRKHTNCFQCQALTHGDLILAPLIEWRLLLKRYDGLNIYRA